MSDINIKINVDNQAGIKSVKDLDKSIDSLTGSIDNLDKVTTSGFSDMGNTIEGAGKDYKKLQKDINKTSDAQQKLGKSGGVASKGLGLISKGAKGVGLAFKAMGIGALIGLFVGLWDALKKMQPVMDFMEKVTTAISIAASRLFGYLTSLKDIIVQNYKAVSDATGGFDAMKKVIKNLINIAITPLKINFELIKAAVIGAQLIWEKSFLGKGDEGKIAELNASLLESKNKIKDLGQGMIDSALAIKDNIGEAVGEVKSMGGAISKTFTEGKDAGKGLFDGIKEQTEALVEGRKEYARLEQQQAAIQLKAQKEAELQRQIRDDVSKTSKERIAANDKLKGILDQQQIDEQNVLNAKIEIAKQELALDENNEEAKLALVQLRVNDQLELEERIIGQLSEQKTNAVGLAQEQADEILAIEQEELDKSNAQIAENNAIIAEYKKISEEEKLQIERDAALKNVEESTLSEEEKLALMLEIHDKYAEDKIELEQKIADKQIKIDEDLNKKKIENLKTYLAVFSQVSALMSQIAQVRMDRETSEMERSQQSQLDNFTGTAEEREELEKQFANDRAQLEYDHAVKKKRQSIIDATIATAVAVAAALPNVPLSVLAGGLGAAQIGIITATQVPAPVMLARGGILDGPSHQNGGISTPYGEVEGNEGIINANSIRNPSLRNIASAVNVAGGGKDFGTGDGAIELSSSSINAIVSGINNKQVVLNTNELTDSNDAVELIDSESIL